jgi:hypothetical protein
MILADTFARLALEYYSRIDVKRDQDALNKYIANTYVAVAASKFTESEVYQAFGMLAKESTVPRNLFAYLNAFILRERREIDTAFQEKEKQRWEQPFDSEVANAYIACLMLAFSINKKYSGAVRDLHGSASWMYRAWTAAAECNSKKEEYINICRQFNGRIVQEYIELRDPTKKPHAFENFMESIPE